MPSENPGQQAADPTDRRDLIAEAATELIAQDGMRALTHRALDARLGLPAGSASYYFRTRDELLAATLGHLRAYPVRHIQAAELAVPLSSQGTDLEGMAALLADYLESIITARPHHIKARYALALELSGREEFSDSISDALVSRAQAVELFTSLGSSDPQTLAAGFLALLEGLAFRSLVEHGAGALMPSSRRLSVFREAIASYLLGVAESELPA
ncbi:TetR family transcriptional regulator [Arthrobacter sp. I2-34]|uniref:TetR family transcriptional regulator n=1 Tax=Arthrobacter hankyongi TaxID=2904801 RepID=A0ABS9L1Q5_9MICC|nr:TetR family transcriptional regulator [Arthrobacter hankyongi]MCG2620563.1 TetR family transcriptional regulator [Arthrobacter hankyongi]